MAGYCSICGSLKIQETCLLCGSLNNNSTLEDGSGSGAGDASVQDYSLHRFIEVPIPPPAFHTSPHPNVSPPSPLPAKGFSTYERFKTSRKICRMDQNRDPTTPKDASGDGQPLLKKKETASSRDHLLDIFSEVPVPPPSFFTGHCRTCSDVPVLSPSFYTTVCRSSSDVPVLSPSFYTTLFRSSSDVAVPPPSFFTSLCRTSSDVPVLSPSFYTTLCLCRSSSDFPVLSPSFYRSSSEIINSADLELSKPSTSLNLHHSPSRATGINPNISRLSPSPTKAGSTELPPPRTGVMPSGQGELLKPSSSQNLPSSPQAPWMNPNVSPLSPSPAKGASDQWPPLPVLRPAVSDLFLLSSLPTGHGDMPIGSPVIPQEGLDHEMQEEGSTEEEDEEVCIEKDGEYLRISIKCPCSKEFQLLVSGNHCYYRLT